MLRYSRPHLIGGNGDYVWKTGKFSNPPETGLEERALLGQTVTHDLERRARLRGMIPK
jgi:hypothetical protein